jgi:hypothetical protein
LVDRRSSAWVGCKGTSCWTPDSDDSQVSGVGEAVGAPSYHHESEVPAALP